MATDDSSTATRISNDAGYAPFFYLRITGFPYYFFSTIDPASTVYGSSAWSAPSGYATGWNRRGMMLPDDSMVQEITDLMGCIATPERLRARIPDFDATDTHLGATTTYKFFGRLAAPGRALTNTSEKVGYLNADLLASTGAAGTFTARTQSTFAASGDVYVGGETIGYSSQSTTSNVATFTIAARNKYPCHANYPATPYYSVNYDADRQAQLEIPVCSQPLTMIGRTVALYVGHMRPGGVTPVGESDSLCRFIGRIVSLTYNAGAWDIEMESIMSDLSTAALAPGLARADIEHQIVLSDTAWTTFLLGVKHVSAAGVASVQVELAVTVTAQTYPNAGALATAVNVAIKTVAGASSLAYVFCDPYFRLPNGEMRTAFVFSPPKSASANVQVYVKHGRVARSQQKPTVGNYSLLTALGFHSEATEFVSDDASVFGGSVVDGKIGLIVAQKPSPSVFIPTVTMASAGNAFNIVGGPKAASRFLTDQLDGNGKGWVRFGDGQIVHLSAAASAAGPPPTEILTTKQRLPPERYRIPETMPPVYYVPLGQRGTVEQVVVADQMWSQYAAASCARFLCSNWDTTYDATPEFDVYPAPVGLGWSGIVDKNGFRLATEPNPPRTFIVDRTTTFKDLFEPIAKLYGLFLVWSPNSGQVQLRKLRMPSSAAVSSDPSFTFNDSNRTEPGDTTAARWDLTHVRTSFIYRYGWDAVAQKFTEAPAGFTDQWARHAYGVEGKTEKIDDRFLSKAASISETLGSIVARSYFYRYPWVRCLRAVNKTGLTLAPGSVHQVIDATVHNPYTGAFGITSADAVYGLLTRVAANPATGHVDVEFLISSVDTGYRPWSPTARVDRTAGTNGYTSGTKTLYFAQYYTDDDTNSDGIDFAVGDVVTVATRDNDGAPTTHNDTVATVAANGASCTLTTGLSAGMQTALATKEAVMVLRSYSNATAGRQSGTTAVSWFGNASTLEIVSGVRNNRWS